MRERKNCCLAQHRGELKDHSRRKTGSGRPSQCSRTGAWSGEACLILCVFCGIAADGKSRFFRMRITAFSFFLIFLFGCASQYFLFLLFFPDAHHSIFFFSHDKYQ